MARKSRSSRLGRRKVSFKEPRSKIIIVCEGKVTEPAYLNDFAKRNCNNLVAVVIHGGEGDPRCVVDRAVNELNILKRAARRSSDSFDQYHKVWSVVDVDEHDRLGDAIVRARDTGVNMAISNPCFELWGFLHFKMQDADIHRHDLQRKLKTLMPCYDSRTNKKFDCDMLISNINDATRRAKVLLLRRKEEGIPNGNPSTSIHKLLQQIKNFGLDK